MHVLYIEIEFRWQKRCNRRGEAKRETRGAVSLSAAASKVTKPVQGAASLSFFWPARQNTRPNPPRGSFKITGCRSNIIPPSAAAQTTKEQNAARWEIYIFIMNKFWGASVTRNRSPFNPFGRWNFHTF